MNKDTEERLLVEMVKLDLEQDLERDLIETLGNGKPMVIDLDTSKLLTRELLEIAREFVIKGGTTCVVLDSCAEIKASLQNIPKEVTLGIMKMDTHRIVESDPRASTHKLKRPYGPLEKGKGGKPKRW